MKPLTMVPTRYEVDGWDYGPIVVEIQMRGEHPWAWAVVNGRDVLNTNGQWEYEPLPSSRTDEFRERTRWGSAEEALAALNRLRDSIQDGIVGR